MYGTGLATVTVFDAFLFLALFCVAAVRSVGIEAGLQPCRELQLYIATVATFSLVNLFHTEPGEVADVTLRTLRYLFYLFYIFFFSKTYFDYRLAKRLFRWIALFATFYLFYQHVSLSQFGRYPKGYVEFLPLMRPELRLHVLQATPETWFRPRSIFGEPSQYGIVVGTYLTWTLSSQKRISLDHLLMSAGLAISGSGTAYLILLLAWLGRIILIMFNRARTGMRSSIGRFFLLAAGVGLVFWALMVFANDLVSVFFTRGQRRLHGFVFLPGFFELPLARVLVGVGMNTTVFRAWPSSVVRVVYYFGLFGLLSFLLFFVFLWKQTRFAWQRTIVLLLFLLSVGNEVGVSSPLLFLILPLAIYDGEASLQSAGKYHIKRPTVASS